jgi:hypothetical protein
MLTNSLFTSRVGVGRLDLPTPPADTPGSTPDRPTADVSSFGD